MTAPNPEHDPAESTPPADPPAPEREAIPAPSHQDATGGEQRDNMLTALNEMGERLQAGIDNVARELSTLTGHQGDQTPVDRGPWTHRGKRRA